MATIINLPVTGAAASCVESARPLGTLAQRYLDALLRMDRAGACELILDAVATGTRVRDVYDEVWQPTQYEVGHLWEASQISIAHEHYCTAVTQLAMSLVLPHWPRTVPVGHRLLAASVGGNLHELGARFVADFFEMAGWDTLYMSASAPTDHLICEVVDRKVEVLAVSATLAEHLGTVGELVAAVRAVPACRHVAVLVGGYAFRRAPDLWSSLGADGSASSAAGAVTLATRLLAAST
jgi:methylmalonyl-CoA mutase cobalamin-binding domain/chain